MHVLFSHILVHVHVYNYSFFSLVADFGILVKSGMHWLTALMFNFLSSLTAIVGFFIGVAISTNSATAKEWLLAIAAGSFLYIALADLVSLCLHNMKVLSKFILYLAPGVKTRLIPFS